MSNKMPVINLMGPTASGKTALACELYEQGNVEIISVDSALVYQDMDIGTAKPSKQEQAQYPHHLIDIISPLQVYSAAEFVEDACGLIDDIHARGKTPVLVGGTMLYFKALLEGLSSNLPSADYAVRAAIEAKGESEGWQAVYEELKAVDPLAGEKFKVSDKQRIIRALEVYRLTGQAITQLQAEQPKNIAYRYNFHNYALLPDRAELHQKIDIRLKNMWKIGFLNEVEALIEKYDLNENLPSARSVGYRQALEYLKNSDRSLKSKQEMEDKSLYATRQLAKRQYTWLRSLQESHQFKTYLTIKQAQEDLRNLYG
ncbi:tRNA (adenosine(37)-N6)-dimethylallyltransferase MiaA [Acinetobacter sichuanensis]|uniref:tRNA dimethylallyltransferase n=1 Tax=Acinetobacter sichuanensis TaxID=2136183 RepID=A0A371YQS4_9GAMM|nr:MULTISPECIES: tRNA (adenosine(37)-N6)-dimethylallyltransferase MiaA [Acinetobacter]MDM1247962.1 tRNA (adenosine(37)-N6)-dimethylallyltransferase MiaA [Acinetobacter sp. R933-2]MDM1764650.1 tRNA (adenosine(37)-N6)-dimethylallyltransferase MiaA [Acinetobacter sp. 226-1]MDM1768646.1 tRNA (adenosine(37)-N6)-dimethylallyltransferase MiaA [Acinetobacter sp. 226-4]MDQ9021744.1 tRNA (adenosine(37)-N6)-dimethylallyltransferase MiaA [Acinetobacter sichuanensis]RFC83810.1 tRNA (adenosine(37)-N6)-dimet